MSDGIRIRRKNNHRVVVSDGIDRVPQWMGPNKWQRPSPEHGYTTLYSADVWEEIPPTPMTENVTGECALGHSGTEFCKYVHIWIPKPGSDKGSRHEVGQLCLPKGFSLEQVEAYVISADRAALMIQELAYRSCRLSEELHQAKQSALIITRTTEQT